MMGKTIKLRKEGGTSITLTGVTIVTRTFEKKIKYHHTRGGTTVFDDGRTSQVFAITWFPFYTGTGDTKEKKVDDLIDLAEEDGEFKFDWGVSPEPGYRTFDVGFLEIKENDDVVSPNKSFVTVRLIKGDQFGGV